MSKNRVRRSANALNTNSKHIAPPKVGAKHGAYTWALLLLLTLVCTPAAATTKGLNQIVTPDIQPQGVLSVSLQVQNAAIANPEELQLELGLTKSFEIAAFRGFSPGETILGAELGIVQSKSFLLSAGMLGVERGQKSQPFLEGGYYRGRGFVIAGVQRQSPDCIGIMGAGYQATPRVQAMVDYLGGAANFATAGVTVILTPALSFNPAIYITNPSPHRAYGYGVFTWNVKVW